MKKGFLLFLIMFLCLALFAQQIKEESIVINVEVAVRVYESDVFVDDLTIDDFEAFEDGVPQKIEAVYLVRGRSIERSEENKRFSPKTSRNFFLLFEVSKYSPQLGDAVHYFISNVMYPDDFLTVITPVKDYRMKGKALFDLSRDDVARQLQGVLRSDVFKGYSEYWSLIDQLEAIAQALSLSVKGSGIGEERFVDSVAGQDFPAAEKLINYSTILKRIENMRRIDDKKLLNFAKFLRDEQGQKHVFLFYEREYIPQIEPDSLAEYMNMFQGRPDMLQIMSDLFEFYKREILFDLDRVRQAFSDSSIAIQFLFIPTPMKHVHGVWFQEHTEDIYSAFEEIAQATGGYVESSANPLVSFKNALNAAENYYLVYYSPLNYTKDGKFKEIKIRVKNKKYKVSHRAGYFAN